MVEEEHKVLHHMCVVEEFLDTSGEAEVDDVHVQLGDEATELFLFNDVFTELSTGIMRYENNALVNTKTQVCISFLSHK